MECSLQEKISTRSLRVGVIGLGYVGLPLAITFAEAGFHVTGIDLDQLKVDSSLVLGVAYKGNVSDIRESPALDIIQALMKRKALVLYNDEYVPSLTLDDQIFHSQPLSSDLLQSVDCLVIVADHSYYDVPWIIREARCIVDARNLTRGYNDEKIFRL